MKTLYITITFILYYSLIIGQQTKIDSLKTLLINTKEGNHLKRMIILNDIGNLYYNLNEKGEGLEYYLELVELAKELKKSTYETRGYLYLGEFYLYLSDSLKLYEVAENAIKLNGSKENLIDYYSSVNILGRAHIKYKRYNEAAKLYSSGIENMLKTKKPSDYHTLLNTFYSNGANALFNLGENEKSIEYLIKAYEIGVNSSDVDSKTFSLYSIAYRYMSTANYQKSETYFLNSLAMAKSNQNVKYEYANYHGLGILYSRWSKYEKAKKFNFKALNHFRQTNNLVYEFDVLNNMATLYLRQNKKDSTLYFARKTLNLANEIGNDDYINSAKIFLANAYNQFLEFEKGNDLFLDIENNLLQQKTITANTRSFICSALSGFYKKKKDFKKSLFYLEKHKIINDSLTTQQLEAKFTEIETKYQTEQKEKQLAQQKVVTQEQKLLTQKANTRNFILTFSLVLVTLILLASIQYARFKRKELHFNASLAVLKAKQQEQQEIGMELHDNITKRLEQTAINLERKGDVNESEKLIAINSNLREIAKKMSFIDFKESPFSDQIITLAASYQDDNLRINIEDLSSINWTKIKEPIKYNLYLIIREAISNSYNHSKASVIRVSFAQEKKEILVSIQDNGEGFDKDQIAYGSGLRNMNVRVKDMNGSISIDSAPNIGTNIAIQFALI